MGETARIRAEVKDEDGQVIADYAVKWETGDTSVATVSQAGLVRAEGAGTAPITATAGLLSADATVTADLERDALVALYEATGGDDWENREGWLPDDPLSAWYGVETNPDGQVVVLELPFNDLSGSLPPEIGNLAQLRELYLHFNGLSGSIPRLYAHENALSGEIPAELGDLSNLTDLWLGENELRSVRPAPGGHDPPARTRRTHAGGHGPGCAGR